MENHKKQIKHYDAIQSYVITFSQCGSIEKSDFFKTLPPSLEYMLARETHKDGGYHIHALIKLKKPINKTAMLERMKIKWPDDFKRIDIHSLRSRQHLIAYLMKEDTDPLTNIDLSTFKAPVKKCPRMERLHKKIDLIGVAFYYENIHTFKKQCADDHNCEVCGLEMAEELARDYQVWLDTTYPNPYDVRRDEADVIHRRKLWWPEYLKIVQSSREIEMAINEEEMKGDFRKI